MDHARPHKSPDVSAETLAAIRADYATGRFRYGDLSLKYKLNDGTIRRIVKRLGRYAGDEAVPGWAFGYQPPDNSGE